MGPTDAEGSRLAVVFVHGLSGSWQNWLENLPHFARRHRVIAPDLPGFGHSPMPSWKISIEGYGHLLHNLCEALGIGDCAVVGNSMGGFICAEAASAQPERFDLSYVGEDNHDHRPVLIHRAVSGFQGQSGLTAWMYRILINCCYDAGRKRERHAETELASEPVAAGLR